MAGERARLLAAVHVRAVMLGRLHGLRTWKGRLGSAELAGPVRKPEQAWAAAAPSSFLPLLFVANLVGVNHKY